MLQVLSGIIFAFVIMLALFYLGVGVFIKGNVYDAKMASERISGAISALASTDLNGTFIFRLPAGGCEIHILNYSNCQEGTYVIFPSGSLFMAGEKTATVANTELSCLEIVRPTYVNIEKKSIKCDPKVQKALVVEKINRDIKFGVI